MFPAISCHTASDLSNLLPFSQVCSAGICSLSAAICCYFLQFPFCDCLLFPIISCWFLICHATSYPFVLILSIFKKHKIAGSKNSSICHRFSPLSHRFSRDLRMIRGMPDLALAEIRPTLVRSRRACGSSRARTLTRGGRGVTPRRHPHVVAVVRVDSRE